MRNSSSFDKDLKIGAVFTPLEWAEFAIREFGLFEKWMDGATIFDPTCGEGNLFIALFEAGRKKGFHPNDLPVEHLFGVELNEGFFEKSCRRIFENYGLKMPDENFVNADFLFWENPQRFDILFGNPPWQNFADLPESYKAILKPLFFQYGLIGNPRDLLLGSSRADLASLVITKAISKHLKPGGEAVFFMPLSLLLNDGASRQFRQYQTPEASFQIDRVFDFKDLKVFDGVATRCGLGHFWRDKPQTFPADYQIWKTGEWHGSKASPAFHSTDPWSISELGSADGFEDFEPILLPKTASPRQGLNTCGANEVFFFDVLEEFDDETVTVTTKVGKRIFLPTQFVFPLITSGNFSTGSSKPEKWVLLPHGRNGKPLEASFLKQFPLLWEYLFSHRDKLANRKGTLIQSWIQRGYWWALLGVGAYNFFPCKIVWEAFGKKHFQPRIFSGEWQANQALQAFIPLQNENLVSSILDRLRSGQVEKYLLSQKMEGTMNWAQPGKLKKLIRFEEDALTLF